MNVTVEDLIASYRVRDVMNVSPVTIAEYASLQETLDRMKSLGMDDLPVFEKPAAVSSGFSTGSRSCTR